MSISITGQGEFRPEIEQGWTRSALSGLDQGMEVRDPIMAEINPHSRLRLAAGPVLDSVARELLDTRFSLLLADRSAQIVDRRVGGRAPARTLERVKAIPGAQYVESVSGTNSLSTAFETKQPVSVSGSEHFLEALRVFSCFGAPIIHPITGRLEGVLDITGPHEHENDLLKPFLLRAVADIADRLRSGSRLSDQRLFAEFQTRTARSGSPVVAFGRDLVLSNSVARDLLTEQDLRTVKTIAEEAEHSRSRTAAVTLASGHAVRVHVDHVEGRDQGTIIELELDVDVAAHYTRIKRHSLVSDRHIDKDTDAPQRILISGEPGSGKTTLARSIASALVSSSVVDRPMETEFGYLDCAEVFGTGNPLTTLQLRQMTRGAGVLVLDNIQVLNPAAAEVVRQVVNSFSGHIVSVTDRSDPMEPALRSLQALTTHYEPITPLRDRGAYFSEIVDEALVSIAQANRTHPIPVGQSLRIVPSALEALRRQQWPGNRTELQTVLSAAARGRSVGDITLIDLPITHRYPEGGRLSRLESVERRAILEALTSAGGNKKRAAEELGIGRTTLYARLRHYRIDI